MAELPDFTKLVPGFEFLQGLVKNAGAAMPAIPGMSQWIAPTLDPEELDKRIGELKTVQFWLEQNARLLGTTIQAMEVQRMTLSTLKTMNVKMDDLRESMTAKVPPVGSAFTPSAAGFPAAFASAFKFPGSAGASSTPEASNPFMTPKAAPAESSPATSATADSSAAASAEPSSTESAASTAPAVDPMKWWGALTEQFATLAATAIKDGTTEAQRTLAGITAATAKATRPPRAAKPAAGSGSTTAGNRGRTSATPAESLGRGATESPAKTARGTASGTIRSTGSAAKTARAASPSSRRTTSR
jgi:hypothetical protein